MKRLFDELKESLEEAIEYERGSKNTRVRCKYLNVPKPPASYKAKDVKRIRLKNRFSQEVLAIVLNVSPRTVESWEAGLRHPSHAALRLLEIIDKGLYPDVRCGT